MWAILVDEEDGVAVLSGKVPDALAEQLKVYLSQKGLTVNAWVNRCAEEALMPRLPPPVPKKPPPIPTKKPTRQVWEILRVMNSFLLSGAPRHEVWNALVRECTQALDMLEKSEWCTRQRYDELVQMAANLDERHPLDVYERGCLHEAEVEYQASLPTLRLGLGRKNPPEGEGSL